MSCADAAERGTEKLKLALAIEKFAIFRVRSSKMDRYVFLTGF